MKPYRSFVHRALAVALVLALGAACAPAQPATPTAAPTQPAATVPATAAPAATVEAFSVPTTATVPTATYTTAASDFSKLPSPLEGWQKGNLSAPIRIVEYGDFQ